MFASLRNFAAKHIMVQGKTIFDSTLDEETKDDPYDTPEVRC